jgi:hypothetical protein
VNCPKCGADLGDKNKCDKCDETGPEESPDLGPIELNTQGMEYTEWEDVDDLGFGRALWLTVTESVFSPKTFFGRMVKSGGLTLPLLYCVLVQSFGTMAGFAWSLALGNRTGSLDLSANTIILIGLAVPLLVLIDTFFWSVFYNYALGVIGAPKRDFEATFRVVCYSAGAELFQVIPFIGDIIRFVYKLYIQSVGLGLVHGVPLKKVWLAVVIPRLLCCGVTATTLIALFLSS